MHKEGDGMKKLGTIKTLTSNEIEKSCVSIGFECLDRGLFNPEKCYEPLAKTGVKYARCQTGWARCEKEKGVYDFSWLDGVVDNLATRGITAWFNLGYGNPLYMEDAPNPTAVGCVPIYYGEETQTAWKNFVTALCDRYKDRVEHFEIWNEPDLSHFWHPKEPNPKEYADFVNLTAEVIRKSHPTAKIGVSVSTPYNFKFNDVLIQNLASVDFFSLHAYTTTPEFRYESAIKRIRKTLDKNGFEKTEIWQGEGGYPSWAYKGHWLLPNGAGSEKAQAVWQLRRYFIDVSLGIKRSSFFQMADMWEKRYDKVEESIAKPAAHGILNGITYTKKLSYDTIRYLSTIFSGDVTATDGYMTVDVNSPTPLELSAMKTAAFRKDSTPFYAYWLPTSVEDETPITYTATVCVEPISDPVLIDTFTGEVFEIADEKERNGMVEYTNLPIKNYPLVITERSLFGIF